MQSCFGCIDRMSGPSQETDRAFANPFPDYYGQRLLDQTGKITSEYSQKLKSHITQFVQRIEGGLSSGVDHHDTSVYTGTCGIALLYLHMYNKLGQDEAYLQKALSLVEPSLRGLKQKRVTFACGDAGPLAVAAVLYHKLGRTESMKDCLNRLQSLYAMVVRSSDLPDEFLYGRVGYMFSLLYVQQNIGSDAVDSQIVEKVYEATIASGLAFSKHEKSRSPLMYEWHGRKYLGGAHGLAGILYVLMQVHGPDFQASQNSLVKPSIDYLLTLQFPSGNFPSSIGSSGGDRLVHWCHGAPGWVHMLITAYKTFGEERYLEKAKSCGDVLWERGLLKKGYGICHGTAGNAYGLLALYRLTQEPKFLYQAMKFSEWCMDYGKHGCRIADRPYSLFEGLAGTVYFLVDMLDPANAMFPAYEL